MKRKNSMLTVRKAGIFLEFCREFCFVLFFFFFLLSFFSTTYIQFFCMASLEQIPIHRGGVVSWKVPGGEVKAFFIPQGAGHGNQQLCVSNQT